MKPQTPPHQRPEDGPEAAAAEHLSALADGRADAAEAACLAWRDSAEARRTWHMYQLIGDVLRSEELARAPAADAAFLARLRERLAVEPVVLAPKSLPRPSGRRLPQWAPPAAVAAGVALVLGVLVMMPGGPLGPGDAGAPQLATLPVAAPPVAAAVPPPMTPAPQPPAATPAARLAAAAVPQPTGASAAGLRLAGQGGRAVEPVVLSPDTPVIRDGRLDEYLRAHQAAREGVATAAPGGALRRVDAILPPEPQR